MSRTAVQLQEIFWQKADKLSFSTPINLEGSGSKFPLVKIAKGHSRTSTGSLRSFNCPRRKVHQLRHAENDNVFNPPSLLRILYEHQIIVVWIVIVSLHFRVSLENLQQAPSTRSNNNNCNSATRPT